MDEVSIGIDLGTSSVKVVALSPDGRAVAQARRAYDVSRPHPGWAEQDPRVWWRALCEATREVVDGIDAPIAAVGLSGQMHGLVLLDESGEPTRPAIIWSDARSLDQVAAWLDVLEQQRVEHLTGFPVSTGMLGVSLTWVRDHEPEVLARSRWAVLPKDVVRLWLTDAIACEPIDAGSGIVYDIRTGAWSAEILQAVGIDRGLFPDVVPSLGVAGAITDRAARATGLPPGTPVAAGGGDTAMTALGLGLVDPSRAAISISSGGTVVRPTSAPLDASLGLHVMPHALPGGWLGMGVVLSAGLGLTWLAERILGRDASPAGLAALLDEAATVPAGAQGLVFDPHLGGLRTPVVDAQARGSVTGIGFEHGPAHLVRALVEGTCLALGDGLARLEQVDGPTDEVIVTGGGARARLWRQVMCDVIGRPIHLVEGEEQAATGAAWSGWLAVRGLDPLPPAPVVRETVRPDAAHHALYRERAKQISEPSKEK